jgi:hypothetical protein
VSGFNLIKPYNSVAYNTEEKLIPCRPKKAGATTKSKNEASHTGQTPKGVYLIQNIHNTQAGRKF